MSADERDHVLRHALGRGLVAGVAFAAAFVAWTVGETTANGGDVTRGSFASSLFFGLTIGLVAAPVALVERLFARGGDSRSRALAAGLAASSAAFVILVPAWLQYRYALDVVWSESLEHAWRRALDRGSEMLANRRDSAALLAAASVPFGVLAAVRVRGLGLAGQTLSVLAGTRLVSLPLLATERRRVLALEDVGTAVVLGACVLPIAASGAEAAERWFAQRLTGSAPATHQRTRPRALSILAWVVAGALAPGLVVEMRRALANPRVVRASRSLHARELASAIADLGAGKLSAADTAALASSLVALSHRIRPRVGPDESMAIERLGQITLPRDLELECVMTVSVDHEPRTFDSRREHSWGEYSVRSIGGWVASVPLSRAPLRPGHHELEVSCELALVAGDGARPLQWTQVEEFPFDVVAGGDPDAVRLVTPELAESIVSLDLAERFPHESWDSVEVEVSEPSVAIVGTAELRSPIGQLLGSFVVFVPAHDRSGELVRQPLPQLAGSTELTLTITPDRAMALERSATIREIYGKPIVRRVTVEGR